MLPQPIPLLRIVFVSILASGIVRPAAAQDGPPQYVRDAVRAVETMLNSEGDASIQMFIDEAMVASEKRDRAALTNQLRTIRTEAGGPWDGISVEGEPGGVRLILVSDGKEKQIKVALGPKGISNVRLLETSDSMVLTRDNLEATFEQLEGDGFSGVVFVQLDGEIILQRPFGLANPELRTPNSLNTIFGIGSRPIDFTVAAILLLDQQGKIDLDDSISNYFDDVPADKAAITIRHLMTGQSGLPDFFDTSDDWDPDLAWIDRHEAERRLFSQTLLFTPGDDQEHSHGAFVLLAALIERVSGQSYYTFIRQHFLDPAGMNRTGEYGETRGLSVTDFAAGGGHSSVGLPNIPPNWGPTSWLVKGSGGMYSSLGDLLQFYEYLREGNVLDQEHRTHFLQQSMNVDGSDRGFELFSGFDPGGDNIYLFLNAFPDRSRQRQLFRAMHGLMRPAP
ncbi:MAG: beta-lactamase family protein [Rhodothermia bacterium]|nr:beta-lactamase family protein [Rhodothermia bacterium]